MTIEEQLAEALRERDEARAEVERLRKAELANIIRSGEFARGEHRP